MKKITLLLVAIWVFAACTKTDSFEAIFDGSVTDAVAPIEPLAPNLVNEKAIAEVVYSYGAPAYGPLWDCSEADNWVIVINEYSDKLSKLPEIDFDKYSLVVGRYWMTGMGYTLLDQRAVVDKTVINLYIKTHAWVVADALTMDYFAAIYPKLPDLPVSLTNIKSRKPIEGLDY